MIFFSIACCVSHNEAWLAVTRSQDSSDLNCLWPKEVGGARRPQSTVLSDSDSFFFYHPHWVHCPETQGVCGSWSPAVTPYPGSRERKGRSTKEEPQSRVARPVWKAHNALLRFPGWLLVVWLIIISCKTGWQTTFYLVHCVIKWALVLFTGKATIRCKPFVCAQS